jgi:hypothetical protein
VLKLVLKIFNFSPENGKIFALQLHSSEDAQLRMRRRRLLSSLASLRQHFINLAGPREKRAAINLPASFVGLDILRGERAQPRAVSE